MGRGLSELQKYIITTAATKEIDEYHPDGRLYNAEIFAGFYGWRSGYYDNEGNFVPHSSPVIATPNFHPGKLIDRKKYNTAQVVVRKACDRLEKRGLVEGIVGRSWAGVRITDKGREVAATIPRELTPEEIAVLDRADNEPPEGSPACDPWAGFWICRECWGGLFESFSFIHAPTFCPLCGKKNTLVRQDMVPDAFERIRKAKEALQSTSR